MAECVAAALGPAKIAVKIGDRANKTVVVRPAAEGGIIIFADNAKPKRTFQLWRRVIFRAEI